MLNVHDVHFDYAEKSVLCSVNFHVNKGQLLHLRGANGSGKTTLLKLLLGLLSPHQGEILYREKDIANDIQNYRQHLCYVGHKHGVSPLLTIREHYQYELQRQKNALPLEELMMLFKLVGHEDTLCGLLSAGQRRKVGLLRLFLSDASLWLLDEPFTALDQSGIDLLMFAFQSHLARGGMVVLTSHQSIPAQLDHLEYCL